MRFQQLKLQKGHSTKAERRFLELCKKLHIPFQAKVKINGQEIDFLIGKYAIEIDGHTQNTRKNLMLVEQGFTPIHIDNWAVDTGLEEWLKNICQQEQEQISSPRFQGQPTRRLP